MDPKKLARREELLRRLQEERFKFARAMGRTGDRPWIPFLGAIPTPLRAAQDDLRQIEVEILEEMFTKSD